MKNYNSVLTLLWESEFRWFVCNKWFRVHRE
jgi:hypothetical protein